MYCGDLGNNKQWAERAPQIRVIEDIYVYSDIVQPSLVSNSLANLLDVIPVMSCVGENGVHRPAQLHYVRLHGGYISAIEIRLCQENGDKLPILHGDVLSQLKIRRVLMARV